MADDEPSEPTTSFDSAAESDDECRPNWWRRNAAEFEAYDLPAYEPPRFADGVLTQPVLDHLERVHGVEIHLRGFDVTYGDDWTVVVDGEPVADVPRHRSRSGHSVLELDSDEFVGLVESSF